jgi:hypothetical protein
MQGIAPLRIWNSHFAADEYTPSFRSVRCSDATWWITTLSSKVNLPHVMNFWGGIVWCEFGHITPGFSRQRDPRRPPHRHLLPPRTSTRQLSSLCVLSTSGALCVMTE